MSKLIFFLAIIASSGKADEFGFLHPYPDNACKLSCAYTTYWSTSSKMSDSSKALPPPYADVNLRVERAYEECIEILPTRYSKEEDPTDFIKWLITVECMNSKGWYLKVSPYSYTLRGNSKQ
ncbi:hypothetical protein [Catenovulum maritimum]|uniref:Uncharacterized protein n=1 Tax=Catenovulum maritimum TaxID=1513271 RepID=A0A0J8JIZ3_9ALTE|nr:hypothetical protein [Catenovulum maritimum]KMT64431.1 hypothetical protein XM47_14125 [Catenovulum maritimum]